MKLAVIISHPIQYYAPFFKQLAVHPQIDLMVYFCTDFGIQPSKDPSFGEVIRWDIPLLDGYGYKFLKNYSLNPSPSKFWGVINPGIISELLDVKYDAIIIPGYSLFSYWLAFLGAWLSGTRILFRGETVLRPDRPLWLRAMKQVVLRPLFKFTNAFLSIGSKSDEFYQYYGVPREEIFFTPYSVDNDRFIKDSAITSTEKKRLKKGLLIPENLPLIVFVGKLIPRKRPLDLLEAFSRLGRGTAVLLFVGGGSEKSELERVIREKDIKNVLFSGFVNQGDLPKYYGMSDIFAFPSSSQEVSPLVINEAMCAGLPIVISDAVPSAHDFVKDGENGFIVPFGNVPVLAEKLRYLVVQEKQRIQMGRESLRMIAQWNNGVCAENIIKALKLVMFHGVEK